MGTMKPKRRFRVWLDVQVPGKDPSYELVEMPATATDKECNEACADALDTMISNELDTGWDELEPGEALEHES